MNIIELAKQAGINAEADTLCRNEGWVEPLEAFASLVAAKERERLAKAQFESILQAIKIEREACAKVCDELHWPWHMGDTSGPMQCAATIRARGTT